MSKGWSRHFNLRCSEDVEGACSGAKPHLTARVGHRLAPFLWALSSSSPAFYCYSPIPSNRCIFGGRGGMNYKLPLPRRGNARGLESRRAEARPGRALRGCLGFDAVKGSTFFPAPLTRGSSNFLSHRPGRVVSEMPQSGCLRGHHDHVSKRGEFIIKGQAGLLAARASSDPVTELCDLSPQT